jgi:hypothetical protein
MSAGLSFGHLAAAVARCRANLMIWDRLKLNNLLARVDELRRSRAARKNFLCVQRRAAKTRMRRPSPAYRI